MVLLGRPVEFRLDRESESVCITLSPKIHAPSNLQGEFSMNEELIARLSRRYIALDIHKHYSVVAGVNFDGQMILEPIRVEHADLEG